MTEAINQPIRRRRINSTEDTAIGQMEEIDLTGEDEAPSRIVEAQADSLIAEHAAKLKFAEEPITVLIAKQNDRNASWVVECWNNGKGAELLINGKWVESGWLPCDREITTKRKYIEILLRSKTTTYRTEHSSPGAEHVQNRAIPTTTLRNQISVIEDKNPLGRAWLSSIVAERE